MGTINNLRNGNTVKIREPRVEDAEQIIELIKNVDTETLFLARNPGEFNTTVDKEKSIISSVLADKDINWFVAEYEGKVIGQCSIGLVRRYKRYRHRAEVGFMILQDYCDMGIGGKMMEECMKWCRDNGVLQIELDVVTTNAKAVNMYKGFGFEIVGTMPRALRYDDGTYADEYIMVCNL